MPWSPSSSTSPQVLHLRDKGIFCPTSLNALAKNSEKKPKIIPIHFGNGFMNTHSDHFFVRSEHRQIRIEIAKVLYIESMRDYVKIYLQDTSKPVLTLMSLKSLEFQLKDHHFLRIHRSYMVNLGQVDTLHGHELIVSNQRLPVAQRLRKRAQLALAQYSASV